MARWNKSMTLSQRQRRNQYMRLYNIRRQLNAGIIPQPRKDMTAKMMEEYRRAGAQDAIYMPQAWMDDALKEGIKEDMKAIRASMRNALPADYAQRPKGRKKIKFLFDSLMRGDITLEQLYKIE